MMTMTTITITIT
ncbi:Protein of unknown function [Bacillus cereus]|nr:Protein of unknown function [Bacillus cereus]